MSRHKLLGTVELGTFGSSSGAKCLALVLEERNNAKLSRKVYQLWQKFIGPMRSISHIPNGPHARSVGQLWLQKHLTIVQDQREIHCSVVFDSIVAELLRDIMRVAFRDSMISCGGANAKEISIWSKQRSGDPKIFKI